MQRRHSPAGDSGSILIVIMIVAAIASIAVTVAVQAWSTTWRRDSEEELIFRGTQYVYAILAYQKEHGGQYPVRLEDLYKPGPRRLRYIRKLYKDPIKPDGKWGLLYLMPGGRGVYDPKAAQKAQEQAAKNGWEDQLSGNPSAQGQGAIPGLTPFSNNLLGSGVPGPGVPGAGGIVPGALPTGALAPPLLQPAPGAGNGEEETISEPPLGWPIVGVISRAEGVLADKTYKVYKSHFKVNEWQFHVFDFGAPQPQVPGQAAPGFTGPPRLGPGFGGVGSFLGVGGGAQGQNRNNLFPDFPGGGGGGANQGGQQGQGMGGIGDQGQIPRRPRQPNGPGP